MVVWNIINGFGRFLRINRWSWEKGRGDLNIHYFKSRRRAGLGTLYEVWTWSVDMRWFLRIWMKKCDNFSSTVTPVNGKKIRVIFSYECDSCFDLATWLFFFMIFVDANEANVGRKFAIWWKIKRNLRSERLGSPFNFVLRRFLVLHFSSFVLPSFVDMHSVGSKMEFTRFKKLYFSYLRSMSAFNVVVSLLLLWTFSIHLDVLCWSVGRLLKKIFLPSRKKSDSLFRCNSPFNVAIRQYLVWLFSRI